MLGDAEQVRPGTVGAAGPMGGLAVHRHRPQPAAGQHLCLPGGAPGAVAAHAARARRAAARAAAEQGPSQSPSQSPRVKQSRTTRIVFSSGARYRPASGSHGALSLARSAWPARLIPARRGEPVVPTAVNAQTAIAIRQASG